MRAARLLLSIALAASAAACLCISYSPHPVAVKQMSVEGVCLGMSEQEVLLLLGPPGDIVTSGNWSLLRYPLRNASVSLVGGRVHSVGGPSLRVNATHAFDASRDGLRDLTRVIGTPSPDDSEPRLTWSFGRAKLKVVTASPSLWDVLRIASGPWLLDFTIECIDEPVGDPASIRKKPW